MCIHCFILEDNENYYYVYEDELESTPQRNHYIYTQGILRDKILDNKLMNEHPQLRCTKLFSSVLIIFGNLL